MGHLYHGKLLNNQKVSSKIDSSWIIQKSKIPVNPEQNPENGMKKGNSTHSSIHNERRGKPMSFQPGIWKLKKQLTINSGMQSVCPKRKGDEF